LVVEDSFGVSALSPPRLKIKAFLPQVQRNYVEKCVEKTVERDQHGEK
jgi:hypothetical protein